MEAAKAYTGDPALREHVRCLLTKKGMSIQELADWAGLSRSLVSLYLNNNYASNPAKLEEKLREFVQTEDDQTEATEDEEKKGLRPKTQYFRSVDYEQMIGLCAMCQQDAAKGLVVAKSGYGKTHALRSYASQHPRVIYIEGNETMNCKDIVRRLERKVGMPNSHGSIDERSERLIEFFEVNTGYLIIMDEADKLINKYTQKKIELLRSITDSAPVGLALAGEMALEPLVKQYDARFANRMDCYYRLHGLSEEEVRGYLEGYDIDEKAMAELMRRARNNQTGCFRLLDRTLTNVLRLLQDAGQTRITIKVVNEASSMMML